MISAKFSTNPPSFIKFGDGRCKSLEEAGAITQKSVPFVSRLNNPPNVPQVRPVETVWSILEQKAYAHNWEAKNFDLLARPLKLKVKELDQKILQAMIQDIRKHLRCM